MADPIVETPPAGGATVPPVAPVAPVASTPPSTPPSDPPAGGTPPSDPPAGAAPEDWATRREKYANGDDKLSKRLARYSSEKDAIDALIAAQNKISSGELKAPLAKDATPEQIATWREENGLPAEPTGYALEGITIPEAGQENVNEFLKTAHANNMTPEQVRAAVAFEMARGAKMQEERLALDATAKVNANAELDALWGSEATLNKNLILGMLNSAPEGVADKILGGRTPDGTPIASDVDTLRWLASLAREVNPTATIVPGNGTSSLQVVETELAALKQRMATDRTAYFKDAKAQARFRELTDLQGKLKK